MSTWFLSFTLLNTYLRSIKIGQIYWWRSSRFFTLWELLFTSFFSHFSVLVTVWRSIAHTSILYFKQFSFSAIKLADSWVQNYLNDCVRNYGQISKTIFICTYTVTLDIMTSQGTGWLVSLYLLCPHILCNNSPKIETIHGTIVSTCDNSPKPEYNFIDEVLK